jgi:flagellar basal body rod protein FlgB
MLISDLLHDGATPALEAMVRFAAARQRMIAHNIANISTPNFRQSDADPAQFQAQLRRAIETRRRAGGSGGSMGGEGALRLGTDGPARQGPDGTLTLVPSRSRESRNILFHDRNNRGIEQLMADQAENLAVFRVASDLLRSRHETLRAAIAERV